MKKEDVSYISITLDDEVLSESVDKSLKIIETKVEDENRINNIINQILNLVSYDCVCQGNLYDVYYLLNNNYPIDNNNDNSIFELKKIIFGIKKELISEAQDISSLIMDEGIFGLLDLDENNDCLLHLYALNRVLEYCEEYLENFIPSIEEDVEDIDEPKDRGTIPPKHPIFSPSAKRTLMNFKDDCLSRVHFSKPFQFMINGASMEKKEAHILGHNKKIAKVISYRNPKNQARIYAYPLSDNFIYVFDVRRKKDDWSKAVEEAIVSKSPNEAFIRRAKAKLNDPIEKEKLLEKSLKDVEEISVALGIKKVDDTIETLENDSQDLNAFREEALEIVNNILGTNYDFNGLLSQDECDSLESIHNSFDRIYSILPDISYDNSCDELIEDLRFMLKIKDVTLDCYCDYMFSKNLYEINSFDKAVLGFDEAINIDVLLDGVHQESHKKVLIIKTLLFVKKLIISILNHVDEKTIYNIEKNAIAFK